MKLAFSSFSYTRPVAFFTAYRALSKGVVIENGSSKKGTYTLNLGFLEGLLSIKKEGPTQVVS